METQTPNSNTLPSGKYMLSTRVDTWILDHYRFTLNDIVRSVCPTYKGELGDYYKTEDLKSVMMPDLFSSMECDCVTYMIFETQ